MEEIFPREKFKTYSKRIKTLDSKKQRASQHLESDSKIGNAGIQTKIAVDNILIFMPPKELRVAY